jgi:CheY-like chemotaxis protein
MSDLRNKSVLVVDDDLGMLRAMTRVLSKEGMRVTGVSDPTVVVAKLMESESRFDLVITDLRMPMFSGRGVLALASALPKLPVIIITAFGGPDAEAQAIPLGAFAFLEKPVAAAELIDVVKACPGTATADSGRLDWILLPSQDQITACELGAQSFRCSSLQAFHFEHAAAHVKIALGKWHLDLGLAKFFSDRKIEIAAITAWPGAHLTAPDHQLKIDRVVTEFFKENTRSGFF